MLCGSVFSPLQCILAVGKSLLFFSFLVSFANVLPILQSRALMCDLFGISSYHFFSLVIFLQPGSSIASLNVRIHIFSSYAYFFLQWELHTLLSYARDLDSRSNLLLTEIPSRTERPGEEGGKCTIRYCHGCRTGKQGCDWLRWGRVMGGERNVLDVCLRQEGVAAKEKEKRGKKRQ